MLSGNYVHLACYSVAVLLVFPVYFFLQSIREWNALFNFL